MEPSEQGPLNVPGGDRFRVLRRIGEGGTGVVYEVFDAQRREVVALKTMRELGAGALYRLKQEFRSLTNFAHPNVVSLHELLSEGSQWFFTMEYVPGVDFVEWVRPRGRLTGTVPPRTVSTGEPSTLSYHLPELETAALESVVGPLPADHDLAGPSHAVSSPLDDSGAPAVAPSPPDAVRLHDALRQLAEALSALHGFGKLHRDIKSSNVLVDQGGRVVLLDFDLVTSLTPRPRDVGGLELVGTPEYMSPEHLQGGRLSEASDWYSVGVLLYQALTGQFPHRTDRSDLPGLIKARLTVPVQVPAELRRSLPELSALAVALLQPRPEQRPSGPMVLSCLGSRAAPTGSPRSSRPLLVGRAEQLGLLRDALAAATAGRTNTLYVQGASGMGKSALVRHFLDQVEEAGGVVLEGHCYERESVPYKGLDDLVDALSRYLATLGDEEVEALLPRHHAALVRVFPVLERVRGIARAPHRTAEVPDVQELRRRGFAALRELLGRLADRHPLVLHIDDFQWGDRDSAALIGEIARPPDSPALLLVITFRSDGKRLEGYRGLLPEPADGGPVGIVEVTPLPLEEATTLARALVPPHQQEVAQLIARESGGNPFFIYELARHRDVLAGSRARGSLDEVLSRRLEELPPGALELLEVVAVAGRPLPTALARQAAGVAVEDHTLLTLLRSENLLRVLGTAEDLLETFHDRIREVAVRRLSPALLRSRHRAVAEALRAAGNIDPERLVEHLEAAGELEEASRLALQAAESAERTLAFESAAKFYQRAIRLGASTGTVSSLSGRLGDALANAGRCAEAAEAYMRAAAQDPGQRSEFKRRAAEQFLVSGHIDSGLRVTGELLELVGMSMAPSPWRALLSMLRKRALLRLRGLHFREVDVKDVEESELFRIDLCWAVARGLAMVDTIRAADFQTRHLLMALASGEPYRVARGLALEAALVATRGRPALKRVETLLEGARKTAARVNNPHASSLTALMGGACALLIGEWRRSLALCEEAEALLKERCTGVAWELSTGHVFTLGAIMYLGQMRELRRRASELMAGALERGNLYAANDIRTRNNIVWLAADDPAGARRELDAARMEWSKRQFFRQHFNSLLARVQIELYEGKAATALERIDAAWPELKRSMLLRIQLLRIEAHYLRARAALGVAARAEPALVRVVERAAEAIEREGMPYGDPLAMLLRAGIGARRGELPRVAVLLEQSIAGFQRADMRLYETAARRILGELVGGERGRALVGEADRWMEGEEIRHPARMARMLAPVLPSSET